MPSEHPGNLSPTVAATLPAVPAQIGAAERGTDPVHAHSTCANCGQAVTDHYCAHCGQRFEHEIHSVRHFIGEAAEDLTHADSRLWSTLAALLFKPGFLTREFLAGRRVRYLPPLRLYLVLSVVFFLVAGWGGRENTRVVTIKHTPDRLSYSVDSSNNTDAIKPRPGETNEQRDERLCSPDYQGPWRQFVLPFLKKSCHNMMQNEGRTVTEAFLHNLPKGLIIFLPLLALFMKLIYWRPRRYYVEHLLFFVHTHAFIFLLFGVLAMLELVLPESAAGWLNSLAQIYVVYYVFVAMRRVYAQSRWRTFAKLALLSCIYLVGAFMILALTGLYSVYAV